MEKSTGRGSLHMMNFWKSVKKSFVLSSVVSILLGIVLLLYPGITSKLICYFVGAMILIHGVTDVVRYYKSKEAEFFFRYDLIIGLILCGAGIFMLLQAEVVVMIIPLVLGIFIMVDGCVNIKRAFEMKNFGFRRWWAALVAAVLMAVLGAVMLWNPFEAAEVTIAFIGIVLLYEGISDLVIAFFMGMMRRKMKKALEEDN